MSDKTEEPSPRRLRKAQEDGDVPMSAALVSASAFFVALSLVPAATTALATWATSSLRATLTTLHPSVDSLSFADVGLTIVTLSAPVLLAGASVAAVVAAVQAGGTFASSKLAPDLSRLSPIKGLSSLFSSQRLISLLRSLITATAVVLVTRSRLRDHLGDLAATLWSPAKAAVVAGELTRSLARDVALVLLVAAFADLAFTRMSWRKKHMMTRAEVKQEHRESEGDPQLKSARERAHHELLAAASINAVKNATVVIVNPTHLATALRYQDGEDEAPRVLSKGDGLLAKQIVEAARAYGIPVVQDVPLARALQELEIGDEIPEALFEAVAEILRALWEAEEAGDGSESPEADR